MPSYQYRCYHIIDKTVLPTDLSLTWESPYLGKTVFILRRGPGRASSGVGDPDIHFLVGEIDDMGHRNVWRSCKFVFAGTNCTVQEQSLSPLFNMSLRNYD